MEAQMLDLIILTVSLVFFVIAVAYVYGCQSLKGGARQMLENILLLLLDRRLAGRTWSLRFCARRNSDDPQWLVADCVLLRPAAACGEADGAVHGPRVRKEEDLAGPCAGAGGASALSHHRRQCGR
jgi:hypothetical protein